jgi:hypothetical protein
MSGAIGKSGGASGLAPSNFGTTSYSPIKYAAEGGKISGIGSGISDSIPAMLSNGEFVVNAASASKYKNLLEGINSGTIAKFADGGLVGNADIFKPPTPLHKDTIAAANKKKEATTQTSVFNINVTGDISMQTRAQIQRLIPEIAVGVNQQNREKGNRR